MKNSILPFFLLLTAVFLYSCKKGGPSKPTSGTFKGTFKRLNADGGITAKGSVFLAINDKSNTFQLNVNESNISPHKCSGNYYVPSSGKIVFQKGPNVIVPETDRHFILDTTYTYTVTNAELNFEMVTTESNRYTYEFVRF